MSKCNSCNSERILTISAKCSDMFSMGYKDMDGHGYVPKNLFFGKDGWGDYVNIDFCLDCGKIQSKFPISDSTIKDAMEDLTSDD